jgi:hypothetical protein
MLGSRRQRVSVGTLPAHPHEAPEMVAEQQQHTEVDKFVPPSASPSPTASLAPSPDHAWPKGATGQYVPHTSASAHCSPSSTQASGSAAGITSAAGSRGQVFTPVPRRPSRASSPPLQQHLPAAAHSEVGSAPRADVLMFGELTGALGFGSDCMYATYTLIYDRQQWHVRNGLTQVRVCACITPVAREYDTPCHC